MFCSETSDELDNFVLEGGKFSEYQINPMYIHIYSILFSHLIISFINALIILISHIIPKTTFRLNTLQHAVFKAINLQLIRAYKLCDDYNYLIPVQQVPSLKSKTILKVFLGQGQSGSRSVLAKENILLQY